MSILDHRILQYSFDEFQTNAIKTLHKNTLINAGAGSGKTSTIIGRILYLLADKNCDPNHILVLAYNNNVAKEIRNKLTKISKEVTRNNKITKEFPLLQQRLEIAAKLKADEKIVHTFHSYALKLAKAGDTQVDSKVPKIGYREGTEFEKLYKSLFKNKRLNQLIQTHFIYKTQIRNIFKDIKNFKEYKNLIQPFGITLQGETVKSNEEILIANYLLMNGIKYKYEEKFKNEEKIFNPDFHLFKKEDDKEIVYDVYYEHFALDENFQPPSFFSAEEKENYLRGYFSKKRTFEESGRDYFFTYSYQFYNETIFDEIDNEIKKRGIKVIESDYDEAIRKFKASNYSIRFLENIATALQNYKINELSIDNLLKKNKDETVKEINKGKPEGLAKLIEKILSGFFEKLKSVFYSNTNYLGNYRETKAFIEIFEAFFNEYQSQLQKEGIDFDDQILLGKKFVNLIKEDSINHCIVDEFQDISVPRSKIIQNLQNRNKNLSLFVVGDDWQSINGFSGSNYRIMTKMFEEYFGEYNRIDLAYTYRFNDKVCSLTKKFVEKNPDQIKKDLTSFRGKFPKDKNDKIWNQKIPIKVRIIPDFNELREGMTLVHRDYREGVIRSIKITFDSSEDKNEIERILTVRFKKKLVKIDINDEKEKSKIMIERSFRELILKDVKQCIDKLKDPKKTIMFLNRLNHHRYQDGETMRYLITEIHKYLGCKGIINKNKPLEAKLFKEVSFLTAHSSKGLEADYVFILKAHGAQGFPNSRKTDRVLYPFLSHHLKTYSNTEVSLESLKLEEERRLFYVALTRSKNSTYIYTAGNSVFLDEIMNDNDSHLYIDVTNLGNNKNIHKIKNKPIVLERKNNNISYHQRLKTIKAIHKNAYNKWSRPEEKRLIDLNKNGKSVKEISLILKRQESGIRSRMKKLNLI